jgi:hypothetical protein
VRAERAAIGLIGFCAGFAIAHTAAHPSALRVCATVFIVGVFVWKV